MITGHPFDTIKVRLQSQQRAPGKIAAYRGTLQTFLHIQRHEGFLGLFKGMTSPMVGVAIINASLFGVYGGLLDLQQRLVGRVGGEPTIAQVFWAGAGSGLANSLISGPTELVKIQLQNQTNAYSVEGALKGPWDCFRRIYARHGLRGCFLGLTSTALRETPSYGVYFATFEWLQRRAKRGSDIGPAHLMLAGGLSGITGWLSTYPMDMVKTRIQAQPLGQLSSYSGILDCLRKLVGGEGPAVLWRGLGATLVRAFPTNAVIFLAYSSTMDLLDDRY